MIVGYDRARKSKTLANGSRMYRSKICLTLTTPDALFSYGYSTQRCYGAFYRTNRGGLRTIDIRIEPAPNPLEKLLRQQSS